MPKILTDVCSPVDKESNLEKKIYMFSMNYNTYNCLLLETAGKMTSNFFPEINKTIVVLANVQEILI